MLLEGFLLVAPRPPARPPGPSPLFYPPTQQLFFPVRSPLSPSPAAGSAPGPEAVAETLRRTGRPPHCPLPPPQSNARHWGGGGSVSTMLQVNPCCFPKMSSRRCRVAVLGSPGCSPIQPCRGSAPGANTHPPIHLTVYCSSVITTWRSRFFHFKPSRFPPSPSTQQFQGPAKSEKTQRPNGIPRRVPGASCPPPRTPPLVFWGQRGRGGGRSRDTHALEGRGSGRCLAPPLPQLHGRHHPHPAPQRGAQVRRRRTAARRPPRLEGGGALAEGGSPSPGDRRCLEPPPVGHRDHFGLRGVTWGTGGGILPLGRLLVRPLCPPMRRSADGVL